MDTINKYLIVIAGPTAVGKTSMAVTLAEDLGGEIISADSRQFFKEMNIGTAKPTQDELSKVPHHFINNLSVHDDYDAGKFGEEAEVLIERLFESQDVLFLVGGSGLYIKGLLEGFDDIPEVPESVRTELIYEVKINGPERVLEELKSKDLEYYNTVDQKNIQRVIRALEVIRFTNKKYSDFRKSQINKPQKYNCIKIGLEEDRPVLYERINERIDLMIASGLFEEAAGLYELRELNALKTVGYREIFGYVSGLYDKDEAIRLLKRNSRRYAKRQLTWFKKGIDYKWFNRGDVDSVKNYIIQKIGVL